MKNFNNMFFFKKYFLVFALPLSFFITTLYDYIIFSGFDFLLRFSFYAKVILIAFIISIGIYFIEKILNN